MTPGGSRGLPLPFLPISFGRNGDPAGQAGPGALRPEAQEKPLTTQRVRSTTAPPARDRGEPTSQGPPCDGPSPDHSTGGKTAPSPLSLWKPPKTVVQWYQQNQNRRRWLWQRSSCWH